MLNFVNKISELITVKKGAKLTITTKEKLTVDGHLTVKQIEETTPGAATEPSYTVAIYIKGPEGFIQNAWPVFDQTLTAFRFLD